MTGVPANRKADRIVTANRSTDSSHLLDLLLLAAVAYCYYACNTAPWAIIMQEIVQYTVTQMAMVLVNCNRPKTFELML